MCEKEMRVLSSDYVFTEEELHARDHCSDCDSLLDSLTRLCRRC